MGEKPGIECRASEKLMADARRACAQARSRYEVKVNYVTAKLEIPNNHLRWGHKRAAEKNKPHELVLEALERLVRNGFFGEHKRDNIVGIKPNVPPSDEDIRHLLTYGRTVARGDAIRAVMGFVEANRQELTQAYVLKRALVIDEEKHSWQDSLAQAGGEVKSLSTRSPVTRTARSA